MLLCLSACADGPRTAVSPSPLPPPGGSLGEQDGAALKAHPPQDLAPNDTTVTVTRPTLSFANASGAFVSVGFAYDVEVQDAGGGVICSRIVGEAPAVTTHTPDVDLARGETYWWRVRARLEDGAGPWSDFAAFAVAVDDSAGVGAGPSPAPGGPLPFSVPGECGPFGPGDRGACVAAMLHASPWWGECHAGSGVGCHRFTRSVAAALAVSDARWGLISKNPGEQQCTWNWCAGGDGSGYGEDIVAYHTGNGNWIGWDIVLGAGGAARAHTGHRSVDVAPATTGGRSRHSRDAGR